MRNGDFEKLPSPTKMTRDSLAELARMMDACEMCKNKGMRPTHDGSPRCESGSIASGGTVEHCTCDVCF